MWLRRLGQTLREANTVFTRANASFLGGAIAFQAVLSLAPLLVVALAVTGFVFGRDAARHELEASLVRTLGATGAHTVGELIDATSSQRAGLLATLLGIAAMLIGATSLFSQLQDALNLVWGVQPRDTVGIRGYARDILRKRVISFGLVLLVGLSLIGLLVTKTVLSAVSFLPLGQTPLAAQGGELLASCAIATTLFAVLFRFLPDGVVPWRHAVIGGFVTATAISIASFGLGLYLSNVGAQSTYGAAGALTAILLWAYLCAQVFFAGASFTVAMCTVYGRGVAPEAHACIAPVAPQGA